MHPGFLKPHGTCRVRSVVVSAGSADADRGRGEELGIHKPLHIDYLRHTTAPSLRRESFQNLLGIRLEAAPQLPLNRRGLHHCFAEQVRPDLEVGGAVL